MKIMHVETGRNFYGGAQQVIWLIRALNARGVENLLVCPPGSGIDKVAKRAGLDIANLRCSGDLDLGFAWRLGRLARRQQPDVVHCHSRRGADFPGGPALAVAGVPAVLSRRVDHVEARLLAKWRYRPFRKIIAISENVAEVLRRAGVEPGRLVTIRSAVDVDTIPTRPDCRGLRREFAIGEDDFVIAVVAQFIPRKGHRLFLKVVPQLRERHRHIRVLLFGSGPGEAELRELVSRLELRDTVRFAGFRDDLDDCLGCADLLVHPAIREGLGVAMLKAAAAGVPVVALDSAGAREAVAHGRTGLLVPAEDSAQLANAVARLIVSPEMRREFGRTGRQRMKDEFPVDTMAARHIELYETVMNG